MTEGKVIVLVSADAEWAAVRSLYPNATYSLSPFGEWFCHEVTVDFDSIPIVFFQGVFLSSSSKGDGVRSQLQPQPSTLSIDGTQL